MREVINRALPSIRLSKANSELIGAFRRGFHGNCSGNYPKLFPPTADRFALDLVKRNPIIITIRN